MPCLAQEFHFHPKLPAAGHYCKSLSSLIRETYAHCHVPCVRIPGAAGWSSAEDSDDDSGLDEALETKQVILNEMRNRQLKKRSSRCSMGESPTLPLSSSAFAWSYTPLDPRTVLEKASSPKTCVLVEGSNEKAALEEEEDEAAADDGGDCDADDESEAFFSVKSFFTRSTSRAATVASSACMEIMGPPPPMTPEAWERFRDCEGWPFGLCRRPAVLPLPPLPSTPADSWKWRKSASSLAASPAPAYAHRIASSKMTSSPPY
ncbi:hypothetical protein BS78_02G206000 [Paspalum vaginatum]|nr:hypothetical protein BS78_02G206000 [Paspalum vaginatum]